MIGGTRGRQSCPGSERLGNLMRSVRVLIVSAILAGTAVLGASAASASASEGGDGAPVEAARSVEVVKPLPGKGLLMPMVWGWKP